MNTCDTCKFWAPDPDADIPAGACENPAVTDGGNSEMLGCGILLTGNDLWTEPHFGCIHHQHNRPRETDAV